jgi:GTPase SAR1 family protein
MVYDITSYDSYRNIKKWMREVKDYSENGVLLILIGNKSDLKDHREVGYEEA